MITIYKIINNVNDKVYIGQTKRRLNVRFNYHLTDKKSFNQLHLDMRHYGIECFYVKELIKGDFSDKEGDELERFFIDKFKSLFPTGYNIFNGGKKGSIMPNWLKNQIRNKLKGREITWKDKVSISIKEKWQDKEYRDMMVKAHSRPYGKYKKHTKPLRLLLDIAEINLMFNNGDSIGKISKLLKVSHGAIKKRITTN